MAPLGRWMRVAFRSILFGEIRPRPEERPEEPDYFRDLNLDRVVEDMTRDREEYDLKPLFYLRLRDPELIRYRQEVMRDLSRAEIAEAIRGFARRMGEMRKSLAMAGKFYYERQKQRAFLDGVRIYCSALTGLREDLTRAEPRSRGLGEFLAFLLGYTDSEPFAALSAETEDLEARLSEVRYCVHIRGNCVRVRDYHAEEDYSQDVLRTFEKFRQGDGTRYAFETNDYPEMNHVEARILDRVAELHPEVFADLEAYRSRNADYLDGTIRRFDREIQFYLAYWDYIAEIRGLGLEFCDPVLSVEDKGLESLGGFDLALAKKLARKGEVVVPNDFRLEGEERILLVSGPNQGGKTTFARTFGQLHHLAAIGCPVPGRKAKLFLCDGIFTHFEREEEPESLQGKLQDDLERIRAILDRASGDSVIIMNEIFTSTALEDAVFLSREILERISRRGLLCVCVTFIDELAVMNERTVGMVSTVDPENPSARTFRIVRRNPDGRSYARSVAERHGLTYERLRERLAR